VNDNDNKNNNPPPRKRKEFSNSNNSNHNSQKEEELNKPNSDGDDLQLQDQQDQHSNKKEKKCPHSIYFEKLKLFLQNNNDFEGTMMIRGLNHDDDDDDEEEEEDNTRYTMEQMESLRYIIMTKNRIKQFEDMKKLILGSNANDNFLMFNTSFSYTVMDSWDTLKRMLQRKTPAQKLDILIAYTSTLLDYDFWMNDNEGGMDVVVKGLGSAWKRLLKNGDEALGWDVEYTKPGVIELLRQFEKSINRFDDYFGLGKFQYA
jgi:hypothetical protein